MRSERKLEINQTELKKMQSSTYELTDFDRNIEMNERMLQKHKDKANEEQKRIKKDLRKRTIKASFLVAAGIAVTTAGYEVHEHIEGKNKIISEFSEATSTFGIRDDSNSGYIINTKDGYVEFENGVNYMVQEAKDKGMTDQEIAIGLTAAFNKDVAIRAIGEDNYPDFSERNKLYEAAYHENKSKQNTEKGNGK